MAFNYARAASTATRLLTNFGREVTVKRIVLGEYNPETSTVPSFEIEQTGKGVLLEYSTEEKGDHERAGTLITATDRKLLLSVQGITEPPQPSDLIDWNGAQYTVKQVATLAPAGITVMYELMVAR